MTQNRTQHNSIRIIGGDLRSRKIDFPPIIDLRPTTDRVRETLFNWIQLDIAGKSCLDLFAGSGALGIESLSRGASTVTFIEKNQRAAKSIESNLLRLRLLNAEVICEDWLKWIKSQSFENKKYDIVFLDPPFSTEILSTVCHCLSDNELLNPGGKIYLESKTDLARISLPENWHELKKKKAGQAFYGLYTQNSTTNE